MEVGTATVNSKGMALDRRIEEIERMIGVRACVDETTGKSIYWSDLLLKRKTKIVKN